jgi:hypothetical protein
MDQLWLRVKEGKNTYGTCHVLPIHKAYSEKPSIIVCHPASGRSGHPYQFVVRGMAIFDGLRAQRTHQHAH